MINSVVFFLVSVSALGNGLLAGAGLDYAIKQLPARHRIGIVAYSKYFKASDLANGRFWYIPLGMGMYIANVGSAVSSLIIGAAYPISVVTTAAAVAAVVHLIGTTQAAPAGLSVLKIPPEDEALLTKAFDKFSWWSYVRCIAGVVMFGAMMLALVFIA